MKKSLAKFFTAVGIALIFFGFYLLHLRNSPKILSFNNIPNTISYSKTANPVHIQITSVGISLPIIPAIAKNGLWETTQLGVSYLATSPLPGTKGNSVFYGHNWKSLLGSLPKIKPEDIIEIKFDNGLVKKFEVEYTAIVTPNQTEIIGETEDSRITLYTCTGFLDSKRFVVVAKPIYE